MVKWLSAILLIWFIYAVRHVFPPFVVGGIVAYLLLPFIKAFSEWANIRMAYAVALVYIVGLLVGGFVLWHFLPEAVDQFQALVNQREEIIGNLLQQASDAFAWNLNVPETTRGIILNLEQNFGQAPEIVHLGGLLSHGMLNILVCFISSIYFILDSPRVGGFFLRFVPENSRVMAVNLSGQVNTMLRRYVWGQLILVGLMFAVAYVFLHFVMHLRHAFVISLMSGFLEIIPVLGPILATSTAAVVGFSQLGATAALWILIYYILARWFEDYVIVPKVIGHAVSLHPLAVIFAVLCGEVLAGALGMLIAIPVAASVKVILDIVKPEPAPVLPFVEEVNQGCPPPETT